MTRFEDTLKQALSLVEPTRDEINKVRKTAENIRVKVEKVSRNEAAVRAVELGGSYAKGTWLKGEVDIDVFVKFAPDISKKSLEDLGVRIGQQALAPHRHYLRYSEHPYVEGFIDGIRVNVVACYDVEKGLWRSSADRSPYHTLLIKERFDDNLKRESRLLKKFLKGVRLYGAAIKTQGFSGYVCEVLVLKYGSFKSVLEAASSFREGEVVSIRETMRKDAKNFKTPLTILDPVDLRRNLGAAISPENVGAFTLISRAFLNAPNIAYFKGKQVKDAYSQLANSPLIGNLLLVTFQHKPRTVDILWGQLKRSEHHLAKHLSNAGFDVWRSSSASVEDSSSGFIFLLGVQTLPKFQIKMGPKVDMKDDAAKFRSRNRRLSEVMWVGRDLRLYSLGERKHRRSDDMLRGLLSGVVSGSGVAPGLKSEIEAGFEIFAGEDILKAAVGRGWLVEVLARMVGTDEFGFGSG